MVDFQHLFKVTQLVKSGARMQNQVGGIQLLLIIHFAKAKCVWGERPARGAENGEVSLHPSTSPLGRPVGSWPGRWEKVYLASQPEPRDLGKTQFLSDTEISGSFSEKSHQDSEAILMACLITITNVHVVLTACWALRALQTFTCTSFSSSAREVVLSLFLWLQMGKRRHQKNNKLTAWAVSGGSRFRTVAIHLQVPHSPHSASPPRGALPRQLYW